MKSLCFPVIAAALLAASCVKESGTGGEDPAIRTEIPADFGWETTRDVNITVEMPVVDGAKTDYSVVGIYFSPILGDDSRIARGVTKPGRPFRTALTLPAGADNVYVETILPDGTREVRMYAAGETVQASARIGPPAAKGASGLRVAAEELLPSGMPDCPALPLRAEADFDPQAVIRRIDNGKNYQLGASGAFHAAEEYLIPAGVEIAGSIDLSGNQPPYRTPVLYVAGKLTLSSAQIGGATLAVLPGGEVAIGTLKTNAVADNPAVYVFEGGKFTADRANLTSKTVVNKGTIEIRGDKEETNANNSSLIYNAASATMRFEEVEFTNQTKVYNDGVFEAEEIKMNSQALFENYANGHLTVTDECKLTNKGVLRQEGIAVFKELDAEGGGTIYVECHTMADEIDSEGGLFYFGTGAALDARDVEMQNTRVEMASASVFTMDEYNEDGEKGGTIIRGTADEDQLPAVMTIREKAVSSPWWGTKFQHRLEVVYTNTKKHKIDKGALTEGAVMRTEQTVVIPESRCNGGKDPVVPEPEPEPTEEYTLVPGAPYTYCYEDNWPWFGDYDMNDLVVVVRVDRDQSKDGCKVRSLAIEWEPKAAGTTYTLAFAVQLDKVRASEVASVASTFPGFGDGPFDGPGLEEGTDYAVIPFFNTTKEVLSGSNTWPGQQVQTKKYTTTVEFAQPVDASAVRESAMNFFIIVKERSHEIHQPGYKITSHGVVTGDGCTLPSDPFKFYTASGDRVADNYMMWALRIPGEFGHPAEGKDIRKVYNHFLTWAASNGTQHREWYEEEADETLLYR